MHPDGAAAAAVVSVFGDTNQPEGALPSTRRGRKRREREKERERGREKERERGREKGGEIENEREEWERERRGERKRTREQLTIACLLSRNSSLATEQQQLDMYMNAWRVANASNLSLLSLSLSLSLHPILFPSQWLRLPSVSYRVYGICVLSLSAKDRHGLF